MDTKYSGFKIKPNVFTEWILKSLCQQKVSTEHHTTAPKNGTESII
jgi:hypothetical protein